ncbi:MAG: hypothetical protein M5U09_29385, partial [Gammaproteobacteria bacterium]|nr:hypothetical protein [Gammaproteobacteria bacterium]
PIPASDLLNSRTANLHTNLKGRVVQRGRKPHHYYEFVESEGQIKDEDLGQTAAVGTGVGPRHQPVPLHRVGADAPRGLGRHERHDDRAAAPADGRLGRSCRSRPSVAACGA